MTYTGTDIYCDQIIPSKIPFKIYKETDKVLAFYHTNPYWPLHIVVIPKQHIASLLEVPDDIALELIAVAKEAAHDVKQQTGACRVLTNLGEYQDSKHLHFHVSSGKPLR